MSRPVWTCAVCGRPEAEFGEPCECGSMTFCALSKPKSFYDPGTIVFPGQPRPEGINAAIAVRREMDKQVEANRAANAALEAIDRELAAGENMRLAMVPAEWLEPGHVHFPDPNCTRCQGTGVYAVNTHGSGEDAVEVACDCEVPRVHYTDLRLWERCD